MIEDTKGKLNILKDVKKQTEFRVRMTESERQAEEIKAGSMFIGPDMATQTLRDGTHVTISNQGQYLKFDFDHRTREKREVLVSLGQLADRAAKAAGFIPDKWDIIPDRQERLLNLAWSIRQASWGHGPPLNLEECNDLLGTSLEKDRDGSWFMTCATIYKTITGEDLPGSKSLGRGSASREYGDQAAGAVEQLAASESA